MPILLPPKVNGPVSILSVVVPVSGALQGAAVQLLRNGAPIGPPDTANHNGVARLTVAGLGLQPNDQLTATQSKGGDTSPASQYAEPVMGVPTSLSPVIYLSNVHGCTDCVIIGGTVVGATVRIKHAGQEIGFSVADGTQVSVPIFHVQPLPTGAVLMARQEIFHNNAMLTSGETPSLPVTAAPNREQVLVPPQIVPPIYECDTSVLVIGIQEGASMDLRSNEQGNQYLYYGTECSFGVLPMKLNEEFKAKHHFRTCNMESNPSVGVKAQKLTSLPAARILPTVCPGAKQITIADLKPGANIVVYAGRNGAGSLLGEATAAHKQQQFDLPPTLPTFPEGPAQYLEASQSRCQVGQTQTLRTPIEPLPMTPQAPFLSVPFLTECGRLIEVTNLQAGTTLRVTSDQADWPMLSPPILATGQRMLVYLYRTMRNGEKVTVSVTGCGAGPGAATTKQVMPMSAFGPPKIHAPLRSWMNWVKVIDCMPGAQVHVFVGGKWRARGEAFDTVCDIFVGDLKVEDRVTALQCLCTKISHESPPESVTPGKMRVELSPNPAIRKPQSQSVKVIVKDDDDKHEVPAKIHLPGGSAFDANTSFNWIFPLGQAGPAVQIKAAEYSDANATWPVADPPPVAPPTATLTLQLLADAPAVINNVSWSVYKQEIPPNPPSPVGSVSGSSAQIALAKPASGQIIYYIACTVDFSYGGQAFSVSFVKHDVSVNPGMAMIGWPSNTTTGKFALVGALVANDEGGYDPEFLIYFWGLV